MKENKINSALSKKHKYKTTGINPLKGKVDELILLCNNTSPQFKI